MIRHLVLFEFHDDHDVALVARWRAALDGLVGEIPGLRSLTHGPETATDNERAWDYAIAADFDSLDDVRGYADHPAHRPLIPWSAEFSARVASVDFELPEGVTA